MGRFDDLFEKFALAARQNGASIDVIERASWLPALESKLPFHMPSLFHAFIYSYKFSGVQLGEILLFNNSGEADENELSVAIFRDRTIAECALAKLYLPIGRPVDGSYDPVCLRLSRRKSFDCPIVRLDHEELLQFQTIFEVKVIAASFEAYLREAAEKARKVRDQ
jgi:hypothetical protein